jgi:c-di-GMP-binding flagellar brake protein YcgR
MKKIMMDEKRKHPRTPVGIGLEIHMKGQMVSKARGTIVDLSDGGMSFLSDAMMEEGMSFYLSAKMPLRIRGEVRSIREASAGMNRYGIRFHKIGFSGADESRPKTFVSAHFEKGAR